MKRLDKARSGEVPPAVLVRDRLTLVCMRHWACWDSCSTASARSSHRCRQQLGVSRAEVAFYPSLFAVALLITALVGGPFVAAGRPSDRARRCHHLPDRRRTATRVLRSGAHADRRRPARARIGADHPARAGGSRRPTSAVHHRRPGRGQRGQQFRQPAGARRGRRCHRSRRRLGDRLPVAGRCRWPSPCWSCCCCSAGIGSRRRTPSARSPSRRPGPGWRRAGYFLAGSRCSSPSAWSSAWSSGPPTPSPNGTASDPLPLRCSQRCSCSGMALVRAASSRLTAGRHPLVVILAACGVAMHRIRGVLGMAEHHRCGDRPAGRRRRRCPALPGGVGATGRGLAATIGTEPRPGALWRPVSRSAEPRSCWPPCPTLSVCARPT